MKVREDSLYSKDWLKIAGKDWIRMNLMLENQDIEATAYFLQQSLEKYMKAYLLDKGWKLKKIHELDYLLDEAVKYDSNLEAFRDLSERVSGYYLTERYPVLVEEDYNDEDIRNDIKEAKMMIKMLFGY